MDFWTPPRILKTDGNCQWASLFASPLGFGQSVELVVMSGAGEVLSLT